MTHRDLRGPTLVLAVGCLLAGSAAAQEPSTGCALTPRVVAGETLPQRIKSGDLGRRYFVRLPTGYDGSDPLPLVLVFHGYTGTARGIEGYSDFNSLADEENFIAVYPQSTHFESGRQRITSWNDLAGSQSPGPEGPTCSADAFQYPFPPECGEPTSCNWASCNDDVGFVEDLLDTVESQYCVDRDRVFATGMSNGGMFVHRLGCALPERFAAIAPVAGTLLRGFNCSPQSGGPVALLNLWGLADDYVQLNGTVSSDGYYYTSAEDVMAEWAANEVQACQSVNEPYETELSGQLGLSCTLRARCAGDAEVVDCVWNGAHTWPDGGQQVATRTIWDFFKRNGR